MVLRYEMFFRYKEDGHCKGEPEFDQLPSPTRLQWDIPEKVQCFIIKIICFDSWSTNNMRNKYKFHMILILKT